MNKAEAIQRLEHALRQLEEIKTRKADNRLKTMAHLNISATLKFLKVEVL